MADIKIECPKCNSPNTVSEFTDPGNISCRECKTQLTKPDDAGKIKNKPTVRTRSVKSTVSFAHHLSEDEDDSPRAQVTNAQHPESSAQSRPTPQQTIRATAKLKEETKQFHVSHTMWSWGLFLLLAAGTGILRYGGVLTPNDIESLDSISPFAYLAIHLYVALQICKESVYHGILAFMLPPYLVYYLFVLSDNFYMRATVAGLAVGMGEATMVFWAEALSNIMTSADNWIHSPFHSK